MGFSKFLNTRIPFLGGAVFLTVMVSFGCLLAEFADLVLTGRPRCRPWIPAASANALLLIVLAVCFVNVPFAAASTVEKLAFVPDGDFLVSAHQGGVLRLWRIRENPADQAPLLTEVDRVRVCRGPMKSIEFSLSSSMAAFSCHEGSVSIWQVGPFKALAEFSSGTCSGKVSLSPDGRSLLVWGKDGWLYLWNLHYQSDGTLAVVSLPIYLDEGRKAWHWAGFTPDNRRIIVPVPGYLDYYDRARGGWQKSFDLLSLPYFREMAPSPDGTTLATLQGRGRIELLQLPSGEASVIQGVNGDFVQAMAFSPDGREFITVTSNEAFRREAPAGELREWKSYPKSYHLTALAFSPNGRLIALGREDGAVMLERVPSHTPTSASNPRRLGE